MLTLEEPPSQQQSNHEVGSWYFSVNMRARTSSCRKRQQTSSGTEKIVRKKTVDALGHNTKSPSPGSLSDQNDDLLIFFFLRIKKK